MKTYIYLAFVFAIYILSGVLLVHDSVMATPMFVAAIVLTLAGFWVEARGWELLFEFISGHLPEKKDK